MGRGRREALLTRASRRSHRSHAPPGRPRGPAVVSSPWTMSSTRRGHLIRSCCARCVAATVTERYSPRRQDRPVGCGNRSFVCGARLLRRRCDRRAVPRRWRSDLGHQRRRPRAARHRPRRRDIADDRCRRATFALPCSPPILPANTRSRDSFARTQRDPDGCHRARCRSAGTHLAGLHERIRFGRDRPSRVLGYWVTDHGESDTSRPQPADNRQRSPSASPRLDDGSAKSRHEPANRVARRRRRASGSRW